MRTHYETLEVPQNANGATIRTAYRKLALLHHPDRSKAANAASRFAVIAEAYAILSDPEKRRDYDRELAIRIDRQVRAATRVQTAQQANVGGAAKVRVTVSSDLARLTALFSRGKFQEAEQLAHTILDTNPRKQLPMRSWVTLPGLVAN